METRPPLTSSAAIADGGTSPAEELPGLYRTILDRIAELEQMDERMEAGRIRVSATEIYSSAWDEGGRNRLTSLLARADRLVTGPDRPRGWSMRRRSAQAR
jgi:hypothetical protein